MLRGLEPALLQSQHTTPMDVVRIRLAKRSTLLRRTPVLAARWNDRRRESRFGTTNDRQFRRTLK